MKKSSFLVLVLFVDHDCKLRGTINCVLSFLCQEICFPYFEDAMAICSMIEICHNICTVIIQ